MSVSKSLKWIVATLVLSLIASEVVYSFEIDFSRRRKKLEGKIQEPARMPQSNNIENVSSFLGVTSPNQEIVILNTAKGFVPRAVRLQKGKAYTVYVVNVNEQQKNVSFVLDAFGQYHGTYFGKIKQFEIKPRHEGVFSYQCPEASFEGRLVIYGGPAPEPRGLASERE